ncbi:MULTISPECIES: glycosyltransferase family 2 protein [unclassified Brucella]|uniref:glycosyltransferase family 2 protein n=1 Tax=unclassified Brucella TaxID=2632610 RepID=UPI00217DEC7D|nr:MULTISPECIES: glycosyltransferase family 2 protein [unclassified Brucella]UWF68224.1 glycosyltransferase [Brucella sp. 1315]UWF71341.1 glycosyltransferase [Brucella sp. 2594]
MSGPSVDVVIPNYNYARYLRVCAESVLSQDIEKLRLLIIDNASTDNSVAVAREIAAADPRVELLLRPVNKGPHASFNDGIDWAGADYFVLLFADDFLMPGALQRAVSLMQHDRTMAFTYGRDIAIAGDAPMPELPLQPKAPPYRVETGRAFIERFCRLGVFQIPAASLVVRTSAQKAAGHYSEALPHSDDYHMWLRLALRGRVAALDCIQVGLRTHGENRSQQLLKDSQLQHILHTAHAGEYFFAHEGRALPDCDVLDGMLQKGIAERAYWSAMSHFLRGDARGMQLFRFAFSRRLQTAFLPPVNYLLHRPDTARRLKRFFGGLPAKAFPVSARNGG